MAKIQVILLEDVAVQGRKGLMGMLVIFFLIIKKEF